MKKLLLILICLFVSTEAKSKYIALECEIKKTIYRIYDAKGRFMKNILDTSFEMKTLYLSEKYQWLNDYKISEYDLDRVKFEKEKWILTTASSEEEWYFDDFRSDIKYDYNFISSDKWMGELNIDLNKDSGQLRYAINYTEKNDSGIWHKYFFEEGYNSNGYVSHGVCKKIKKSLF